MLKQLFSPIALVSGLLALGIGCSDNPATSASACAAFTSAATCNAQPAITGFASGCVWLASGSCVASTINSTCGSYNNNSDCTGSCTWSGNACTGIGNTSGVACSFYTSSTTCVAGCNWTSINGASICSAGT